MVCDQVDGWSTKVIGKMNSQLDLSSGPLKDAMMCAPNDGANMSEGFGKITALVCSQLTNIIEENERK